MSFTPFNFADFDSESMPYLSRNYPIRANYRDQVIASITRQHIRNSDRKGQQHLALVRER